MDFWDFMIAVPPHVRMLICLGLTIGISLVVVRLMYPRLLAVSAKGQEAFETKPGVARPNDVIGRFTPFTIIAFVFLTGIAVSQFWTNARLAADAISAEVTSFSQSQGYAAMIPADRGGAELMAALDTYRSSVISEQWPLLQHAQARPAYEAQSSAAQALQAAIAVALDSGARDESIWDDFNASTVDMMLAGTNRIDSVPQDNATRLIFLVMALGIVNLVALCLVSTSYRGLSMLLVGIGAGLVGLLMFIAVEMSNPYLVGLPWPGSPGA